MTMQFAIGLMTPHPVPDEMVSFDFLTAFARTAEDAGFSAVYLTEHPIPGDAWLAGRDSHDCLDPFVGLSFMAAATTTLKLVTHQTVVPYRNPFLLAKAAATLDRLSGGRLILGMAAGYQESEFAALGVDFEERNALYDESVDVCRRTWSGNSVAHQGRHFTAVGNTAHPTPIQQPLPIFVGGNSKLSRRRAVDLAQGWVPMPNPAKIARHRRSAPLNDLDELAEMIRYLRDYADQRSRTDPLDIWFCSFAGGVPGSPGWDHAAHAADVEAQQELGVTWQGNNAYGSTPEETLKMVRHYGETVIARFR